MDLKNRGKDKRTVTEKERHRMTDNLSPEVPELGLPLGVTATGAGVYGLIAEWAKDISEWRQYGVVYGDHPTQQITEDLVNTVVFLAARLEHVENQLPMLGDRIG